MRPQARRLAASALLLSLLPGASAVADSDLSAVFGDALLNVREVRGASAAGRQVRQWGKAPAPRSERRAPDEAISALRRARSFDPDRATDEQVWRRLREEGHAVERHGPDVTEDFLRGRNLPVATKFATASGMVRAAREAWRAVEVEMFTDAAFLTEVEGLLAGRSDTVSLRYFMQNPAGPGLRRSPSGDFEKIDGIFEIVAVLRRRGDSVDLLTLYPQGH